MKNICKIQFILPCNADFKIQIGLRDDFIKSFAKEDIVLIEDISGFVKEQYSFVQNQQLENLMVPAERPFLFKDEELNKKLKIS